jgi:hypothetical protein
MLVVLCPEFNRVQVCLAVVNKYFPSRDRDMHIVVVEVDLGVYRRLLLFVSEVNALDLINRIVGNLVKITKLLGEFNGWGQESLKLQLQRLLRRPIRNSGNYHCLQTGCNIDAAERLKSLQRFRGRVNRLVP